MFICILEGSSTLEFRVFKQVLSATLSCALSPVLDQVILQTVLGMMLCRGRGRVMLRSTVTQAVTSPLNVCLAVCFSHSTDICSRLKQGCLRELPLLSHCVGPAHTEHPGMTPPYLCLESACREHLGTTLDMLPSALLVRGLFDGEMEGVMKFVACS